MVNEYFLKLFCIILIGVKIGGFMKNTTLVNHQIKTTQLQRNKILPLREQDDDVSQKYNWKMQNLKRRPSINFLININYFDAHYATRFLKNYWRKRSHKNQQRKKRGFKNYHENKRTEKSNSDELGDIFHKIELFVTPERKKKNIEFLTNIHKVDSTQISVVPMRTSLKILDKRETNDGSKSIRNWKEILAKNPVLRTDKPTDPEVEFIDEWKYSYRVTFYEAGSYDISNFKCSGILMAPQWILTSLHCNLGDNLLIVIGVYSLPKIILDHNKYKVKRKIYSLKEDLLLIEMDWPVQWKFVAPDIRVIKRDEMDTLLENRKCSVVSWIPVDVEKNRFELRKSPCLKPRGANIWSEGARENLIEVKIPRRYSLCKNDIGSPVVCEDVVCGIFLNVNEDCNSNTTVKLLCPAMEWITYFTREKSYFEISARKWPPTNRSERPVIEVFAVICIFTCVLFVN